MTELIVCLSAGKGSAEYVSRLLKEESWEAAFIITDEAGKKKIRLNSGMNIILTDFRKPSGSIIEDILGQMKGRLKGLEAAVNLSSGAGKEHMAIISAILRLGTAIRFVALSKSGVKEI